MQKPPKLSVKRLSKDTRNARIGSLIFTYFLQTSLLIYTFKVLKEIVYEDGWTKEVFIGGYVSKWKWTTVTDFSSITEEKNSKDDLDHGSTLGSNK